MPTKIWEPSRPQPDTAGPTGGGGSDEPGNSETVRRDSGRNQDASATAVSGGPVIEEINTHGSER
jgi:hypothetical protein